ncbi:kunitz trypsin inhibitor 5-like, partial [Macadamia integrifolia]|uniref:kunitz trypsin inhibitor 5-like n=1 Tax=Macadamia integrifolia TaxID=60698 RepID=UPI001C4FFC64
MRTLLFLFQLLLITSTIKQLPVVAQIVRDTTGEELRSAVEYYSLPVISGKGGGGLTLSNLGNATSCPLDVVQEQLEASTGIPVTFKPVNTSEVIIEASMDLNIKFSAVTTCVQSTVWKLKDSDESSGHRFVTTGGVEGNPGRETLANWFSIKIHDDDYKLFFCPGVCDTCRPQCQDIAIFVDNNGFRRLAALSDEQFKVKFKKDFQPIATCENRVQPLHRIAGSLLGHMPRCSQSSDVHHTSLLSVEDVGSTPSFSFL